MKIRRFVARDMKTALTEIKEELGVDAVIMSNKKVPEGVELMAAVDYNQSLNERSESDNQASSDSSNMSNSLSDDKVSLNMSSVKEMTNRQSRNNPKPPADSLAALLERQAQKTGNTIEQSSQSQPEGPSIDQSCSVSIEQQLKNFTDRLQSNYSDVPNRESQNQEQPHYSSIAEQELSKSMKSSVEEEAFSPSSSTENSDLASMKKEMASIRQLLEHQMAGLMWQDMAQKDPSRAVLVNRLMALGLTESLADQIAGYIPTSINEEEAWQYAQQMISQQLNTTNNDIIQRGGVVALVGPTGVGKTTTVAKLAARFAQTHGADEVALISTDTYRIAGFEQLSTYGRIIGCQVKLAQDNEQLAELISQFANKKLVLIDTAGMGQRDIRLTEHLTSLIASARVRIRNYLVLSANTQQRVMQENVDRFKKIPLAGTIFTKLDESLSVGEIISTVIQNGLPLGYLTDGQRVPEDIKVANAEKLVTLADKLTSKYASNNLPSWQIVPAA